MTGLLHSSDRLLAGELSRVEAARGTLQPLPIGYLFTCEQCEELFGPCITLHTSICFGNNKLFKLAFKAGKMGFVVVDMLI